MGVNFLLEIRSETIWRKAFTWKVWLVAARSLCLGEALVWIQWHIRLLHLARLNRFLTSIIYQQSVGSGSKKTSASTNVQSTSSSNSQGLSLKNAEKLEVTVIPVDDMPYSKIIQIPHSLLGKSQDIVNSMQGHPSTLPRIKRTFHQLSTLVQRKLQVLRQHPLQHQHRPHTPD